MMVIVFLFLLLISCSREPGSEAIRDALSSRYRWFGEVVDVRIMNVVKIDEDTYFAQVKYGIRFKKGINEIEKEVNEKLRGADIYRNLSLFVNILVLNDLIRRCGIAYMEKGRVCYLTETVKLEKVKGSWIIKYR